MFQGRFEHTIDDKGRLAVPSPFRRRLAGEDSAEATVVVTISDQCLSAYALPEWEGKLAQIGKLNQKKRKAEENKNSVCPFLNCKK